MNCLSNEITTYCSSCGYFAETRIGLVLEGGGALGLAHIGVLQWLEEHRIPVEYVSGTSMGGLVGGLYATGHTPAEVKVMVRSINWDKVLQGNTPYKDLSYRVSRMHLITLTVWSSV